MPRRRGRVIKPVRWQRGRSHARIDRMLRALAPGKRRSRRGKIYWETRKNRSDLRGRV